jgi:hypothetical protein
MLWVEVDMNKLIVLFAFAAVGCGEEPASPGLDDTGADAERVLPPSNLQFWWTCGDPVCSGWTPKGLPSCGPRDAGDPCRRAFEGRECDPHDPCNATLLCADADPIDPFGCPI